jgi:hypothetical protein
VIFPDLLDRIQELYTQLCGNLVAKKVAAGMYQRDAISLRELESIQMQKGQYKASQELLNFLLQLPEEDTSSALVCFLEMLKTTNQQHIFLWIMYRGEI